MSVETGSATDRAYRALTHGAVVVDRSDRLRMQFTGDKAAESLTGLVTNDVASLAPGQGQYAAALTAKGKILADVRIFRLDDGFLVDANPLAGPHWAAMIRKFVNPRLAKYQDISTKSGDLGVFGSRAHDDLQGLLAVKDLAALAPYAHVTVRHGDADLTIVRAPDYGVTGYDIIGPRDVLTDVRASVIGQGAIADGADALHIARIEAGRPEWGVDMDDSMLAQEMDMDRLNAISFTKGCYTGQETVARVHYRGHVNRLLRGLRFGEPTLPPIGTSLVDGAGKEVGTVKSAATSPRLGAIALALVRREVEPGATLTATWSGETVTATVESLPFDGSRK
jgi:folate-binding protein YgfZ